MVKFVKPREAAEILGVMYAMPVRWEESGEINAIKTLSGQRRYDIDSYIWKAPITIRKTILYFCVSSNAQKLHFDRAE